MTDSVPATADVPSDGQVESPLNSAPDVCGVQPQKSPAALPVGIAPVQQDSDNYNMEHPNRGTCLVFNHAMYEDKVSSQRHGTYVDVKRIKQTFGGLGFFVDVCDDYKYQDIKKKIKKLSEQNHEDSDCVCIIVLSHGQGNNVIHARDEQYPLNTLWEPFTANNCISLAAKPKLFFISACRGEKRDRGVMMHFKHSVSSMRRTETDGLVSSSYVIPAEADFLFGFSTPAGYCSWRSMQEGTWYIQSLCDVLDEYAAKADLVDILTKTAQQVTKRSSFHDENAAMHNQKQVPEFHSRLLRRVYFTPKPGAITSQNLPLKQEPVNPEPANSKPETVTSKPATVQPETVNSHSKESKFQRCDIM